jgi:multidrug transporter EmrE-like cation transporter
VTYTAGMNLVPILLILGGGVVLTAGDIMMKQWVEMGKTSFYAAGLALYFVGLIFLAQSFRYQNIAVASIALVVGNVVMLALFSWLYYHQGLSVLQLFGIVVGIIAFITLEIAAR